MSTPSKIPPQQAAFASPFMSSYMRVHRGDGMKSVLCFPSCKEGGHKTRTFCGDKVKVVAHKSLPSGSVLCGQIRNTKSFSFQFKAGQVVPRKTLISYFYEHPMDPTYMLQGKVEDTGGGPKEYHFDPVCYVRTGESSNSPKESLRLWHYEWAVTRQNRNSDHCFTVYIFHPHGTQGDLILHGCMESTPFQITPRSRTVTKRQANTRRVASTSSAKKVKRTACGTVTVKVEMKAESIQTSPPPHPVFANYAQCLQQFLLMPQSAQLHVLAQMQTQTQMPAEPQQTQVSTQEEPVMSLLVAADPINESMSNDPLGSLEGLSDSDVTDLDVLSECGLGDFDSLMDDFDILPEPLQ